MRAIFSLKLGHDTTKFRLQPKKRLQISFWGQNLCLVTKVVFVLVGFLLFSFAVVGKIKIKMADSAQPSDFPWIRRRFNTDYFSNPFVKSWGWCEKQDEVWLDIYTEYNWKFWNKEGFVKTTRLLNKTHTYCSIRHQGKHEEVPFVWAWNGRMAHRLRTAYTHFMCWVLRGKRGVSHIPTKSSKDPSILWTEEERKHDIEHSGPGWWVITGEDSPHTPSPHTWCCQPTVYVPHPFRRKPVQHGRESAMEQTQPVPFAQPEKQVLERSQLEAFRTEQTFFPFLHPMGKQSSQDTGWWSQGARLPAQEGNPLQRRERQTLLQIFIQALPLLG